MKILESIKWIGTVLTTTVMGMFGGQKEKGVRRFGIPGLSTLIALSDGFQWRDLAFLLLIPTLVTGYGENSILMGWAGSDGLVRVVYALMLSIPFFFFGLKRGLIAIIALVCAFQIRAGSLGNISWFGDLLIEDVFRYLTLGGLISFSLFKRR